MYHTGDNPEISYYSGGIQQSFNEKNAMDLLKKECEERFALQADPMRQAGTLTLFASIDRA